MIQITGGRATLQLHSRTTEYRGRVERLAVPATARPTQGRQQQQQRCLVSRPDPTWQLQTCLVLSASHIASLLCSILYYIVAEHHRTCSELHQSAFLRLRPRFHSSQPAVNTDFWEVYKTGRQKCLGCQDMRACKSCGIMRFLITPRTNNLTGAHSGAGLYRLIISQLQGGLIELNLLVCDKIWIGLVGW